MDAQRVNEIQVLLEGVPLPASRDMLVQYAEAEDPDAAAALRQRLPDEEFDQLDKVGALLLAEPGPPHPPQSLPVPESGEPPGGDDYLNPSPQPGAVRPSGPADNPPQKAIEKASELQKKQKAEREG